MDVKMETPPASLVPVLPPLTAAESERIQFDCDVRLWGLRVRFLAQKLLSLGRSYEVRYRLPPSTPTGGIELPHLGFDLMSLMDSHLLQVKAVTQARFPQQIVNERVFAGVGVPRADDVHGIHVEDYLVGMDLRNFLVQPVPLPQLRKQLQRMQNRQAQQGEKVLVLRFVRLDRHVQVDRKHTHGQVLETLAHIEVQHADLSTSYTALLERNRAVVTRELTREKKLLSYVRIIAVETKKTVMQDEKFQFAFNFQQWLTAISAAQDEPNDDSDSDDGDSSNAAAANHHEYDEIEIEISDDDDGEEEEDMDQYQRHRHQQQTSEPQGVVDLTAVNAAHSRRVLDLSRSAPRNLGAIAPRAYAKTKTSHPLGPQKEATPPVQVNGKPVQRKPSVPRNPDMSWLEAFAGADLKWLPHAQSVLASFIGGMMDSFEQDEATNSDNSARIPRITESIAEQLLRLYIHRRHTQSLDNAALHKEFARHVRMLRSNLKNSKNSKLREDLLDGAVTTARLCEMSIDELAPEALRLERERRYELHAQSSMIKAPTGPTLVKTKHGYKEVNFGGITGSQESDPQATDGVSEPPAADTNRDNEGMASAPFEYDDPSMDVSRQLVIQPLEPSAPAIQSSSDESDVEHQSADDVVEKFQKAMDIQPRSPVVKKRVSFAEDSLVSFSQKKAELAAAAASKEEMEREKELERRRAKARAEDVRVGKDFLRTLFDPAHDIVDSLRQFIETLRNVSLATMSREFVLATGVKVRNAAR